jgi:hypothetical protein
MNNFLDSARSTCKRVTGNGKALVATAVGGLTVASTPASAALPTEVTSLMTSLAADVGLIFGATVAIWVAVRGSMAIYKLGNRFISKAGA